MKKTISLLLIASFYLGIISTNAQNASSETKKNGKNASSSIYGAWQSVDHKRFMIMNDGFFSNVTEDSTGIWRDVHAGSYTIDNANTITLKILYSSFPSHVGRLHTVEYEMSGDTLTMKWYKKLIDAKDGDITAQMPTDKQTQYVRAKK
jgi:hypothetical protein